MNYRHSMNLLGIPTGDIRAFKREGGKIKAFKDGGSAPGDQNVTTTSIPEYARPYVEKTLGRAYDLSDIDKNPYQPYDRQRTAAFTPLQAQAMQNVSGMQTAGQITDASNLAYTAGQQGLGAQQIAAQLQNKALGYGEMGAGFGTQAANLAPTALQYGASGAGYGVQGMGIGQRGVSAAEQGFGAGQAYAQQATSPEAQRAYMSPYMQNVVDVQQKEAVRQADIQRQINQAQAAKQGAFGGSRSAIVESEGQRNLQDRLAQIQATGSQTAFDKAQQAQQFGAGLGIQGLQAGYQGLQTGIQGTGQAIQGAQAGLQGVGQAGQMYDVGIRGAQSGLQGVQAATGAGQYGLAGASLANQSAGTLGQLGQTQFGQEAAITDAQMRAGQLQQQQEQRGMDIEYQQYLDELNHPYKQVGFMSDLLRGLPLSQGTSTMYNATPPVAQQFMGLGLGAAGLQKAFS